MGTLLRGTSGDCWCKKGHLGEDQGFSSCLFARSEETSSFSQTVHTLLLDLFISICRRFAGGDFPLTSPK